MSPDDPDFPECLRMGPPGLPSDDNTLQRSMSMVSLDGNTTEKPPTQVVSMSDDDLEIKTTDWADQMNQESEERQKEGSVSF